MRGQRRHEKGERQRERKAGKETGNCLIHESGHMNQVIWFLESGINCCGKGWKVNIDWHLDFIDGRSYLCRPTMQHSSPQIFNKSLKLICFLTLNKTFQTSNTTPRCMTDFIEVEKMSSFSHTVAAASSEQKGSCVLSGTFNMLTCFWQTVDIYLQSFPALCFPINKNKYIFIFLWLWFVRHIKPPYSMHRGVLPANSLSLYETAQKRTLKYSVWTLMHKGVVMCKLGLSWRVKKWLKSFIHLNTAINHWNRSMACGSAQPALQKMRGVVGKDVCESVCGCSAGRRVRRI